jgi:hypothetical protein
MKLVHQGWQLVGQILIVDDDGNAVELGKNEQGQAVKTVTVNVPVARFDDTAFFHAHGQARVACEQLLMQVAAQQEPVAPADKTHDDGGIQDTTGDVQ